MKSVKINDKNWEFLWDLKVKNNFKKLGDVVSLLIKNYKKNKNAD